MTTVFYIAAAVAVFSTLMAITRANAVHALLYMITSLLSASSMQARLWCCLCSSS